MREAVVKRYDANFTKPSCYYRIISLQGALNNRQKKQKLIIFVLTISYWQQEVNLKGRTR